MALKEVYGLLVKEIRNTILYKYLLTLSDRYTAPTQPGPSTIPIKNIFKYVFPAKFPMLITN